MSTGMPEAWTDDLCLPVLLDRSIDIDCSPAAAWSFVRDMENYPRWFPYIVQMEGEAGATPTKVGTRYAETAIMPGGREKSIAVTVVAGDDEARHLAIEADLEPVLPRFDYFVMALANGRTRFRWLCRARGKGARARVGRIIMPLVLRPRLDRAFANIRRILEAKPETLMRSAHFLRFGSPEDHIIIAHDAARPVPRTGEVVVRQIASSVNMIDCHRLRGYGRRAMRMQGALDFPVRLGNDIAGVVTAVGAGIVGVEPGDEVLGVRKPSSDGAFGDLVVVPGRQLIKKPQKLDFHAAAALPYTFVTAWCGLVSHGGLTKTNAPGKRVFVQGGAGGVGAMAVQIAKAWGAEVSATCGPHHVDIVRGFGVDRAIDYTADDFAALLSDYDIALCTADTREEARMTAILKHHANARYVTVIHPTLSLVDELGLIRGLFAAKRQRAALNRKIARYGQRAEWVLFQPHARALADFGELLAQGQLRPVIDSIFPLERVGEAMQRMESGAATGKVVIDIGGSPDHLEAAA